MNWGIIFNNWIWKFIWPLIGIILKIGINGIGILIEEMKNAEATDLKGSAKLQYVVNNALPKLKEMGKDVTLSELNAIIEMLLQFLKNNEFGAK